MLREIQAHARVDKPPDRHATYPEPGGLIPVGGDTGFGVTFWTNDGPPESWRVMQFGDDQYWTYDMGIVDFLVGWLSGELVDAFFWRRTRNSQ